MTDLSAAQTAGAVWPTTAVTVTEPDETPSEGALWAGADDRTLVRASVAGRREAFDELVVRHRRSIYQLCYRFVGCHEDAADLAQEVFLRAYRGLGRFRGQAAVSTWLYRIGVNVCLNRLALKAPSFVPMDERRQVADRGENLDEAVDRDRRSNRVRVALSRLPPRQRATVILRIYRELSHREIAQVLGTSVGAVKANFFHAVGNLRRLLRSEPDRVRRG